MRKEMIGKRFGKLVVVDEHPERKNKRKWWVCQCDCGEQTMVPTYRLNDGSTRSCGCIRGNQFDLTGDRFGKLIVIRKHTKRNKYRATMWVCRCKCGDETLVTTGHLRAKNVLSCGKNECLGKHGCAVKGQETDEYLSWVSMRGRCNNKSHPRYKDYGGRGIKVCQRWGSFENFLEDMGQKPSDSYSLERVNNDKGYNPDNCIWANDTTQNRNQRIRTSNTSGVSGVHWRKDVNKWVARISVDYKRIHLGMFDDLKDAKKARKDAEIKYWNN